MDVICKAHRVSCVGGFVGFVACLFGRHLNSPKGELVLIPNLVTRRLKVVGKHSEY